ncbi:uncharacterized protein LOC134944016 [Pseudophryne corroboree]|uniref:uncharacterized protein LOC134944016 n=1 Tax=Pseudophryne corroboree TaxID=495146 RepID=UPI0030812751
MTVTYKMKLILVWLCVISETFAFPTEPPPSVENKKPCCDGQPQLIYQGRDPKHGINVYVFEFPPLNKETKMKDENAEYTTMKNLHIGDGEQYEDTIPEANTPANTFEKIRMSDIQSDFINETTEVVDTEKSTFSISSEKPLRSTQSSIYMPDLDFDPINGQVTVAQDDSEMYGDSALGYILTGGSQAETTHNREVRKTNEHSDNGYYSADGSTLTDILAYNDSDSGLQVPNVYFPSNNDEFNRTLGCTDGLCGNASKYIDDLVTQHTTNKDFLYSTMSIPATVGNATIEQNTVNPTVSAKGRAKPTKTVSRSKDKGNKKPDKSKVNGKEPLKKYSTGRNVKFISKQRQRTVKHGGRRPRPQYHRSSSSESDSDSSQQLN